MRMRSDRTKSCIVNKTTLYVLKNKCWILFLSLWKFALAILFVCLKFQLAFSKFNSHFASALVLISRPVVMKFDKLLSVNCAKLKTDKQKTN